jgi:hypothetical protein
VGFHLSFDYGYVVSECSMISFSIHYSVTSVHYRNGTTLDVAKIQGGPAYQDFMRIALPYDKHEKTESVATEPLLDIRPSQLQNLLQISHLRDQLPMWLGGRDSRVIPISRMLKALKVATESYMEGSISNAAVTLPFRPTNTYYDLLRSACASVSLQIPRTGGLAPAGYHAAVSSNAFVQCSDTNDSEQLVLAVEYSQAALATILIHDDCGAYRELRKITNTSLGTNGLLNDKATLHDLEHALRQITTLPIKDDFGTGVKQISSLVLFGEAATNVQLNKILRKILGEQHKSTESHLAGTESLYTASRGVAYWCWQRLLDARRDDF